jgi:hypothetical protein
LTIENVGFETFRAVGADQAICGRFRNAWL